jgi:DNA-binding NtrC family response regulator
VAAGSDRTRETVVPIVYAEQTIGELRFACAGEEAVLRPLLVEFARVCAHFERRYLTRRWALQHLGQALLLVGLHPTITAVDDFVEKAAATSIPVLITGEFGTEKTLTAAALHACGPRSRRGRFVEVLCAAPFGAEAPASLAEAVGQAKGGTLYLHSVDEMPLSAQRQLLQEIHSIRRLGDDEGARPRLVASTTADLRTMADAGRFSKALLAELDFLTLTLPPLRARVEDVPAQVHWTLEKYGWRALEKASPALVEACRRHTWPDNLVELERTLTRLAVMTGPRAIERGDLLDHASHVLGFSADRADTTHARHPVVPLTTVDQWARHLAAGTVPDEELDRLHEGLHRAVRFIADHSKEQITLAQLARHARVSASHLSFLFRSLMGTTFKELLGRVRIERARRQLVEEPRTRITEVCLESGFLDLSHFEKLFRRVIGESPRQYRRRVLGHDRRES